MSHKPVYRPVVAIIGGGFSGAATAYHLARMTAGDVAILLFEPREAIGAGLAYSTDDPEHRINVPASRMTLDPAEKDQFVAWLEHTNALAGDLSATLSDGRCFPSRKLFGQYVAAMLQPLIYTEQIRHVRSSVTAVVPSGEGWRIEAGDGTVHRADVVVIATSHPPPTPPAVLAKSLAGVPGFITDPWAPGGLDSIAEADRVLIVGTGLTMADVLATLKSRGHSGNVRAISRRGQRSRGHSVQPVEPFGDFAMKPARTARSLLLRVRSAVDDAARQGLPWQGLFDRLRTQGPEIWAALPLVERRRVVRHLRPFWDTHRFRIAPQTEAVLERSLHEGRLRIDAASLMGADRSASGLVVQLRLRNGLIEHERFDAIIVTTGPGHGDVVRSQPFLSDLRENGLLGDDPTGLGLPVDDKSRLIGMAGPHPRIFVAGPLARGTFGELMGLPEVAEQALDVATSIVARHISAKRTTGLGAHL